MAILNSTKVVAKCKKQKHNAKFNCLPKHLISEILARIASTSFTDLFNAKIICKEFFEAGSEDYIFEHVSIDAIPVIPWKKMSNCESGFLKKCMSCENPESLFRQGMLDYFSKLKHDSGIEYLKKATEKGHLVAKYVYAIILVCDGGEFRQKGLKLVSDLKKWEVNWVVKECRMKVKNIVKYMWVNNYMIEIGPTMEEEFKLRRRNCGCKNRSRGRRTSMGWINEEEFDDTVSCEGCLWDIEAIRFCHMLRTGWFTCPFIY